MTATLSTKSSLDAHDLITPILLCDDAMHRSSTGLRDVDEEDVDEDDLLDRHLKDLLGTR
jgi:hypothetical protein